MQQRHMSIRASRPPLSTHMRQHRPSDFSPMTCRTEQALGCHLRSTCQFSLSVIDLERCKCKYFQEQFHVHHHRPSTYSSSLAVRGEQGIRIGSVTPTRRRRLPAIPPDTSPITNNQNKTSPDLSPLVPDCRRASQAEVVAHLFASNSSQMHRKIYEIRSAESNRPRYTKHIHGSVHALTGLLPNTIIYWLISGFEKPNA
uniref:Uncharacterized protein n=1 Tax=Ditylenchus dipsaci TaxID=166011 RepID=A0A915DIA7_9BILA